MGVLQTTSRRYVRFRPELPEHRMVYWRLRSTGRQDENLRFVLEEGYSNLISMMQTKIADHFSQPVGAKIEQLRERTK
jgi:hypothetical protein